MGTLLPQQFFHFTQPAVCADCSILAGTEPGSLRHLSHSTAVTLLCVMEQNSSCPHPLRQNKATVNYKGPSAFVHLSVASPMARDGIRKNCRSHVVGKAQHCTAAEALYHLGILGLQSHTGYITV